ncbi:DNA repair exonuclease [Bacillus sp. RO2]|uniref:metallophosphoesterase family protein n=1 Tax=Bacillus sp. RO2 TaxID=2723913 RepID=UPI00145EC05E|nr:DNA repair exonuclease [Bacillus sp. RO2]NMH73355.1 DNA repair exonuclease [Bacillus sp. RO2]
MKKIRFLHAADLHLDSPFKGLSHLPQQIFDQIRKSTFQSLTNLMNAAIHHHVDFVLLAGDLFDLEQRSLIAQATLRKELLRLNEAGIQVYIIHGNHDYLTDDHTLFKYPDNVHIFTGEVERKTYLKDKEELACIYGFSYKQRHLTENMTSYYEKEDKTIPFHIGMLHGNFSGREEHDPYAPFTLPDLLDKEFHYWALGHIHKREILHYHPPIVYPGNIQGRHKKEQGDKGCYLVDLLEDGIPELTYIETSAIQWEELEIPINELQSVDQLMEKTKQAVDAIRLEGKGKLLRLTYTGNGNLHGFLQEESNQEELQLLLNEGEENNTSFVYIYTLRVRTALSYSKEDLQDKTFYKDFYTMVDQVDMKEALAPLLRHSEASRYLETWDEEEVKAIVEETEQWLVSKFLESEKR